MPSIEALWASPAAECQPHFDLAWRTSASGECRKAEVIPAFTCTRHTPSPFPCGFPCNLPGPLTILQCADQHFSEWPLFICEKIWLLNISMLENSPLLSDRNALLQETCGWNRMLNKMQFCLGRVTCPGQQRRIPGHLTMVTSEFPQHLHIFQETSNMSLAMTLCGSRHWSYLCKGCHMHCYLAILQ